MLSSQADCGVTWNWGPNGDRITRKTSFCPFVTALSGDSPVLPKPNKKTGTPKGFDKFRLGLRSLYDENKVNDVKNDETKAIEEEDHSSESIDFNGSSESDSETITKSLPNIDKVCTNLNNSFLELATTAEQDISIRKVKSSHNFDTKNDLLDLNDSDGDFDSMLIRATQEAEQEAALNWKRELPCTPKRKRSSIGVQPAEQSFDDSINEILSSVPLDAIVSKAYESTTSKTKPTTPLRHSSMPVSPQILKPIVNKPNLLQRHISLPPKQNVQMKVVEQPKMAGNYNMSSESVNCEY